MTKLSGQKRVYSKIGILYFYCPGFVREQLPKIESGKIIVTAVDRFLKVEETLSPFKLKMVGKSVEFVLILTFYKDSELIKYM